MILSHRAPSNLNMSSYRAIWTHFKSNSMILIRKYLVLAPGPGLPGPGPGPGPGIHDLDLVLDQVLDLDLVLDQVLVLDQDLVQDLPGT